MDRRRRTSPLDIVNRTGKTLGYGRHSVDQSDIDAVVDVLGSDFLTQGETVGRFEAALAERVGARHAVAVANGTAALHLACLAGGVGPGDLGLTSAVTFAASANCLLYAGGEAGFVDIEPQSLGMAGTGLARALTRSQVKAVVPVHLGGLASLPDDIAAVRKGRVVTEDAAQALGATYANGKPVGCCEHSDMTIFSFHPVKSITTAEGGAIVTNDNEMARRARLLRNHGLEREPSRFVVEESRLRPGRWQYEMQMLGFNYRMTDIQAALGLSQLARIDGFLKRRHEIAIHYDAAFASLPHLRLTQAAPDDRKRSANHLYVVLFDFDALRMTRNDVMDRLRARGIGSQVHYMPVYRHPLYAERYRIDPADFPEAERYYASCLSLPLYPGLTDEDVEHVIGAVTELVSN
jgi:UDP-4-amino-4,6-dideoxy-N-acetyl-beta-L-altrosamine transaminase